MVTSRFGESREGWGKMQHRFRDSARRGRGASATELIILLVLISLVCIGIFRLFGSTIKTKLTGAQSGVAAVGNDPQEDRGNFDEAASGKSDVRRSATASSSSAGATAGGSSGGGGAIQGSSAEKTSQTGVVQAEAKPGSVGGFNPWILVIFLGLSGLLIYVFFAKKS